MSSMDAEEVDETMAQVRLRAALERHIEASEEVPEEVRQRARAIFRGDAGETSCPDPDSIA